MNGLTFSFSVGKKENRENPNLQEEHDLLCDWAEILEKRYNYKFVVVSNSSDYTTLQPEGCIDLLRLKYGGVKWIKVFITNELSKTLIDDSRFIDEKKKNQAYWKSTLVNTDISQYFDVLDAAFYWLIEHKN